MPQISSLNAANTLVENVEEERRNLTSSLGLNSTLKTVTNSKETHLVPKLCGLVLGNLEVPSATTSVARILPNWFNSQVEQVY
jgi:hypothetical protein